MITMLIPQKLKEQTYKILHKKSGVSKKILLKVFSGKNGEKEYYFIEDHRDCVQILAFDIERNVILVSQYRPAKEEIVLELPGGTPEPKESMHEAAERELQEETGYRSGSLQYLGKLEYSVGSLGGKHMFVAMECVKNGIGQRLDDTERIQVKLETLDSFRQLLKKNKIYGTDLAYLGLDSLGLLS